MVFSCENSVSMNNYAMSSEPLTSKIHLWKIIVAYKDSADAHSNRRRSIYPPRYKTAKKQNCPFLTEEMAYILSDSDSIEDITDRTFAPEKYDCILINLSFFLLLHLYHSI